MPKDLSSTQTLGPLPYGWEQRQTPSGKPYFVDHNSRTTHFTDPRLIKWPAPGGSSSSQAGRGPSNSRGTTSTSSLSASSSSSTSPLNSAPPPINNPLALAAGPPSASTNNIALPIRSPSSSSGVPPPVGSRVRSSRGARDGSNTNHSAVPGNVSIGQNVSGLRERERGGNRDRTQQSVHIGGDGKSDVEVLPKYKRDLNAKIKALRVELQLLQPRNGHCRIEVTRKEIFEVCQFIWKHCFLYYFNYKLNACILFYQQSYRQVLKLRVKDMRKRLMVKFKGEEGLDYGGIAREWLHLLSHEMLNPSYGLFQYSHESK